MLSYGRALMQIDRVVPFMRRELLTGMPLKAGFICELVNNS